MKFGFKMNSTLLNHLSGEVGEMPISIQQFEHVIMVYSAIPRNHKIGKKGKCEYGA